MSKYEITHSLSGIWATLNQNAPTESGCQPLLRGAVLQPSTTLQMLRRKENEKSSGGFGKRGDRRHERGKGDPSGRFVTDDDKVVWIPKQIAVKALDTTSKAAGPTEL